MANRSHKRTPEVAKKLLDAIRVGSTFRLACSYAGIDHATFYRWLEKDATLATAVKEAEGAAVVGWLAKIEKAASEGNWQAAAWKLERRYPEDFGRRERIEQTVEQNGRTVVEIVYSDAAELPSASQAPALGPAGNQG